MKVFFPKHCLNYPNGFIFGWRKDKENVLFAVTVVFIPDCACNFDSFCEKVLNFQRTSFLGFWVNDNQGNNNPGVLDGTKNILGLVVEELVVLRLPKRSCKPVLYFLREKPVEVVLTLYKQPLVNAFLTSETFNLNKDKVWQESFFSPIENILLDVPGVLMILNKARDAEKDIRLLLLEVEGQQKTSAGIAGAIYLLILCIAKRVRALTTFNGTKLFHFWPRLVNFLSNLSAVFLQWRKRFRQLAALCDHVNQSESQESDTVTRSTKSNVTTETVVSNNWSEFPVVSFGNLVTCMLVDIALGLAFVLWFFSDGFGITATDFIMRQTDLVVELLCALLEELKGAPVGLKLNKQLSECLSTFFLWHIDLWKSYLSLIEPYLQSIVQLTLLFGCFGITFLCSLASDVLSLLTLHIYCFYGYAAKLYKFQVQKLVTLAKLFTGRKWNVEKNCVEAVPYKVDQLFLGTLLFAILLFLLPTTAVFYIVFTMLRVMVLFGKGFIGKVVDGINNLPLFALVVAFLKPDYLPGNVLFEMLDAPEHGNTVFCLEPLKTLTPAKPTVYLSLHYCRLDISQILHWQSVGKCMDDEQDNSWVSLLGKVATGELIYPWVKKRKTAAQKS